VVTVKPTDEPERTISDGGSVADEIDAPFETVSEGTMTRGERYQMMIEEWVFAPIQIIWSDWRARIGLFIILLYILMGTVGVWLVEPSQTAEGPRLLAPFQDWTFPLGTDTQGNDLFAQIIHGTPPMLEMIVSGAVFATVMATLVGTFSGYKGGSVDRLLMTVTDILMTIPGLPLTIVLAVVLQPRDPWVVGIILTINAWAGLARAIRSQVLTFRVEDFVEASRLMGISTSTILLKDILPGLMPYILVNFVNSARTVIFSSVGLYFLGILPFSQANWGVMMNFAYNSGGALYTLSAIHWLLAPMITIVILSFGLILFAQGTDRLFNPQVRARHTSGPDVEAEEEDMNVETEIRVS
jgi:peptide/nickel transport system permease protein